MHLLAFSLAGLFIRYLVWPGTLMDCCLLSTLNKQEIIDEDNTTCKMSRLRFFWIIVSIQFIYHWFPGYMFPLLSSFSIMSYVSI